VVSGSVYDGTAVYEYAPEPRNRVRVFTKRKDGGWVEEGGSMKNGQRVVLGYRSEHYDISF
jgi:hypothetical protein